MELRQFEPAFTSLLARWLAAPHVARWYPEPEEHLSWAINPPPTEERAFIVADDRPVGYLRWQVVSRDVLDSVGLSEIPAGSVDVDILIGELWAVGRGIGTAALRLLLARIGDAVPLVGLTTSVHNHLAHRAFHKVGFRILRQYAPPLYGKCHLMVRKAGA